MSQSLIEQIEKAIIDSATNYTNDNIYDEYSSANFEEGTLFAINKIMPLLKKAIEQRNDYIGLVETIYHPMKEASMNNAELIKLLKEQAK